MKLKVQKVYGVYDLFFTSWEQLSFKDHALVYALQQNALQLEKDSPEYGFTLIRILRELRKNKSLVNKIDVPMAVDIYNDLKFLNQPWYFFPAISFPKNSGLCRPEDTLERGTFDHFIYADNEFSSYLVTRDVKHLRRLVTTLYQVEFDKERVDDLQKNNEFPEWFLNLVFFTYANVREFVTKRCKTLLPTTVKHDDAEPDKPMATGAMWLKLKHRLAETPAFQGYDNAGKANMYSALDYLEDLAQMKNANP